MEAKFLLVLALVAVGHSSVLPIAKVDNEYTSFSYDVADPKTGDYKSQVETHVDGNVQGQYSLLESDGTKRIVDYAADDIKGFNAVVRKEPAIIGAPVVSGTILKSAPAPYAVPDNTYGSQYLIAGSDSSLIAVTKYATPSFFAAPLPIATVPYDIAFSNYNTIRVAGRTLASPGITGNPVVTEDASYLSA